MAFLAWDSFFHLCPEDQRAMFDVFSAHQVRKRRSQMRRFARAGELFGIGLNALPRRLVEKDKYQGVAGLGQRIAALARYLSSHAAGVLRNHVAEAVALDGHLLSGFDVVVELDQVLNEPSRRGQDRERTVTDKNIQVLACTSH